MPRTTEAIRAFFNRVDTVTSRKTFFQPEEEAPFNEEKERELMLVRLSKTREAKEALLPMLKERIEQLDDLMPSLLHSHPDLCAAQGRKDEARELLKQFQEWSKGE